MCTYIQHTYTPVDRQIDRYRNHLASSQSMVQTRSDVNFFKLAHLRAKIKMAKTTDLVDSIRQWGCIITAHHAPVEQVHVKACKESGVSIRLKKNILAKAPVVIIPTSLSATTGLVPQHALLRQQQWPIPEVLGQPHADGQYEDNVPRLLCFMAVKHRPYIPAKNEWVNAFYLWVSHGKMCHRNTRHVYFDLLKSVCTKLAMSCRMAIPPRTS